MKRILFLFLPLLPYLATAQVAKDTVTVLTIADIPADAIRDTTNFTFVQDNAFKKATFDSLAKYTRVKLIGDRGDITVSGATGLTWELDAGVVDSMQLSAGAVVLPSAKVTGTLPVSKGGTGSTSYVSNYLLRYNGTKLDTVQMSYKNVDATPKILLNIHPDSINFQDGLLNLYERDGLSYIFWYGPGGYKGRMGLNGDDFIFSNYRESDDANVEFRTRNLPSRFTLKGNGNVGIGVAAANITAQLHTNGSVRFAGLATSGTSTYTVKADATGNLWYDSSDESYKKNISAIPYGIAAVMQLNPVAYNFVEDDEPDLGFIAQDIYNIIPELTYTAQDGKFGVKYDKLVSVLTKAIQEQQAQIEQLKQRITQLENK